MSLGSRIANRGRGAVLASRASTPREPLLFLYPSWIRNSSTASPTPLQHDESHSKPAGQRSPVSIPENATALSEDPADKRSEYAAAPDSQQQNLEAKDAPPQGRPPSITTEDGIASMQREQSILRNSKTPLTTENMVRRLLGLQAHNDDAKQSASSFRKAYQANKREEMQTYVPDWRGVLEALVNSTPDHGPWLSRVLQVAVPKGDAQTLLHGIDDHYLRIGKTHGCKMEATREEPTRKSTSFTISGSAISISKCVAEILSIAPNVKLTPYKASLSSDETEDDADFSDGQVYVPDHGLRVRNVISAKRGSNRARPGLQLRPEDIRKPQEWTQVSLLEYIRDLTTSHVTSHINRFGLRASEDHNTTTANYLRALFKDPDVRPSLTREACHEGMRYFVRGNQIEDARVLFVHMEMLKLRMNPETFNILLAGAAKFEDLHNFHFVLHLMLNRGIAPTGQTWTHFMGACSNVKIQLHIVAAMRKKGLLNHPKTMIEVATHLASHEIESSLNKNRSQREFIADMDSRYGDKWLNVNTGNLIIRALAARGLVSRCLEMYHFMLSRHVTPDKYGVHNILHQCRLASNLAGAIELLCSLPSEMRFRAGEETYRLLFDLAWRSRSYNVARVVWRYACLSGTTSFRMRDRVFTSMLASNRAEPPKTSLERWKKFAGPVIIGIHDIQEHPSRFIERLLPKLENERLRRREEECERKGGLDGNSKQLKLHEPKASPTFRMPTFTAIGNESTEQGSEQQSLPPSESDEESHSTQQKSRQSDFTTVKPHDESQATDCISDRPDQSESYESTALQPSQPPQGSGHTPSETEAYHSSPSFQRHLAQRALPKILDPWGPSHVGTRFPTYKTPILKEFMEADLEMFKQWRPLREFEDVLAEALERDVSWKREEGYGKRELDWFMEGRAVRVGIRTHSSLVKEFEWV